MDLENPKNQTQHGLFQKDQTDFDFCNTILPLVSRTFAINIAYLKGDLHKAVLCGYLFCRIIDTIEDSEVLDPQTKIQSLKIWQTHFPFEKNPEELTKLIDYLKSFSGLTNNHFETFLLENATRVFSVFSELDQQTKDCCIPPIQTMAGGMAKFQEMIEPHENQGWIEDISQLEEYCYYVAGTVGEMLSNLFQNALPKLPEDKKKILQENAVSFGLGLQITNILKDIWADNERHWCYLPKNLMEQEGLTPDNFLDDENNKKVSKIITQLIALTQSHLDKALAYSLAIPNFERSIRIFCFLPLHFAIQTLDLALKNNEIAAKVETKISRDRVKKTILFTKLFYPSNALQKSFYNRFK